MEDSNISNYATKLKYELVALVGLVLLAVIVLVPLILPNQPSLKASTGQAEVPLQPPLPPAAGQQAAMAVTKPAVASAQARPVDVVADTAATVPYPSLPSSAMDRPTAKAAQDALVSPQAPPPAQPAMPNPMPTADVSDNTGKNTGWIYVGQYREGKWLQQGLQLQGGIPMVGQNYPVAWAATVRGAPPGRQGAANAGLGKAIGHIPVGKTVDVLEVVDSGKQGHIWVKVKY